MSGKRRLVLLEFQEDVAELEQGGWLHGDDIQRLCLAPAPALELEALGLDYLFPHCLVPSAAIQAELNDNWARLEELALLINRYVPYGWSAAYYLKLLLDTCMEKIIHLATALQALAPRQVIFFQPVSSGYDFRLAFHESESLYAQLLPHVCKTYSPEPGLILLPPSRRRVRSRGADWHHFKARITPYYRALKNSLRRGGFENSSRPSICVVEDDYGLESIAERLASSYQVLRWAPSSALSLPPELSSGKITSLIKSARALRKYRRVCRDAWREFRENPHVRPLLSCRGIGFFDVVADRLEYLFTRVFPHLFIIEDMADKFFQRCGVSCLISTYFSRPHTYVLAKTARLKDVPVVTMQHSSYGYWDWPIAKYFDGIMSDYKLVGGEGVASYVREAEHSGCRPLPTGLPFLDCLLEKGRTKHRSESRPKVVYPLASYIKNFIHYSNSRLALTEYFEVNRRILSVLGRFPQVEVIVRPHPAWQFKANFSPLRNWIMRQGWQHIRIEADGSTTAAMQTAHLIVIDSPSTVLLQAAATDSKILVFNGIFKMTEAGLAALKKRAIYSDDLNSFLALLENTLLRRDFDNSSCRNDEFLRLYGTYLNDGHSLERAVAAVERVIAKDLNGMESRDHFEYGQAYSRDHRSGARRLG